MNRTNPFEDGVPGRYWYEARSKRHRNVSSKIRQATTPTQVGSIEEKKRHWLQDRSPIFLLPQRQTDLARNGQTSVYNRSDNDEKKNLDTFPWSFS